MDCALGEAGSGSSTVGSLSAKAAECSPRDRHGEPQNAIVIFHGRTLS
jgi:hypothetical protein